MQLVELERPLPLAVRHAPELLGDRLQNVLRDAQAPAAQPRPRGASGRAVCTPAASRHARASPYAPQCGDPGPAPSSPVAGEPRAALRPTAQPRARAPWRTARTRACRPRGPAPATEGATTRERPDVRGQAWRIRCPDGTPAVRDGDMAGRRLRTLSADAGARALDSQNAPKRKKRLQSNESLVRADNRAARPHRTAETASLPQQNFLPAPGQLAATPPSSDAPEVRVASVSAPAVAAYATDVAAVAVVAAPAQPTARTSVSIVRSAVGGLLQERKALLATVSDQQAELKASEQSPRLSHGRDATCSVCGSPSSTWWEISAPAAAVTRPRTAGEGDSEPSRRARPRCRARQAGASIAPAARVGRRGAGRVREGTARPAAGQSPRRARTPLSVLISTPGAHHSTHGAQGTPVQPAVFVLAGTPARACADLPRRRRCWTSSSERCWSCGTAKRVRAPRRAERARLPARALASAETGRKRAEQRGHLESVVADIRCCLPGRCGALSDEACLAQEPCGFPRPGAKL